MATIKKLFRNNPVHVAEEVGTAQGYLALLAEVKARRLRSMRPCALSTSSWLAYIGTSDG